MSKFPRTRYQGSKRKLVDWIWDGVSGHEFQTVLDLFSGTASVAYMFKTKGKTVTTNDYLKCNQVVSQALIRNSNTVLTESDIAPLRDLDLSGTAGFIEQTFAGIYYPETENRWLDRAMVHLQTLSGDKRALAYFCLYQACLAKRIYNLFHRANLYMQEATVARGFRNKATWDKPFMEHFDAAMREANAAVFDNGCVHQALCGDFSAVEGDYDLVYLDPPYIHSRGVGVDYLDFYHFLEGLTEYPDWCSKIAYHYKHKPYIRRSNAWCNKGAILGAFDAVFTKYSKSIIAVSYRSNGIPGIDEIVQLLEKHGRKHISVRSCAHKYALSTSKNEEILIIAGG